LGTAQAGFKAPGRRDLVVMALDEGSRCAAVFTSNAFCAAPVTVARDHLRVGQPRFLVINAGNANAGTGPQGIEAALRCCELAAEQGGCDRARVLPFSTGVIGEPLPLGPFRDGLPAALADLREDGWADAAAGIMTTDTLPKGASLQVPVGERTVTVTGIAKGSGMIRPDMATMLAFVATDCEVAPAALRRCLERAVAASFNRITVDGDMSTNDACVLAATGRGGPAVTADEGPDFEALCGAVTEVCRTLAQAIVRDGEGATKFITVDVHGGRTPEECRGVAYTVAHSPLVKTAFFAGDPNWGRILAAIGRAPVVGLDVSCVEIDLNGVCIVRAGARADDYREERGAAAMAGPEIELCIRLGRGRYRDYIWTCDLSYEYVRINAEYRS